jgi:hypothetical protein
MLSRANALCRINAANIPGVLRLRATECGLSVQIRRASLRASAPGLSSFASSGGLGLSWHKQKSSASVTVVNQEKTPARVPVPHKTKNK